MKNEVIPNPGSKEAQELGCACPVMDNHHGKGYMGMDGVFVYSGDCKVHEIGFMKKTTENEND